MTLHDEYFEYCVEYTNKYGPSTIVLMEVGSFFEAYCVHNEDEAIGCNIFAMCDLLNIQLTRKNKSLPDVTRGNPYLAGFPSYALSKHSQTLLQNHYTVVIIRQVTPPPNPKRAVTDILSPSMQLFPNSSEGNYVMVYYWDTYQDTALRKYHAVGMCGMDVSTGKTWVYETCSSLTNPSLAEDEAVRMLQAYQPKEVVLLGTDNVKANNQENIETLLGVHHDRSRIFHKNWNAEISQYMTLKYQNEVLRKAYANTGMIDPLDALHLERLDNARVAFAYMIQFGYEHNEQMVFSLQHPSILTQTSKCLLEYNSTIQLNVISQNPTERPLMAILNKCATAFGARAFRERLLQPITDIVELESRYDRIDDMMKGDRYATVLKELKSVVDLERIARRMLLGTFSPIDWNSLHLSLEAVCNLGKEEKVATIAHTLIAGYEKSLSMDECAKYLLHDIKGNVFHAGIYGDLDEVQQSWEHSWEKLRRFTQVVESEGKVEGCRVEFNERNGYVVQITKKRWETAVSSLPKILMVAGQKIVVDQIKAKPLSATSSVVYLTHPWIEAISNEIIVGSQKIQKLVTKYFKEFLANYVSEFYNELGCLVALVTELDISATCAKLAAEMHYTRPQIHRDQSGKCFVRANALRHPILEKINERVPYVPNDIDMNSSGMLLFGMNASGKSSFMKSVGLNVLMAQAGMFVAAKTFEYSPYSHIFTRISGQDNIFKGWSTFTVEMLELRNILQRCDATSLVLGDELCAGTESMSALSIVAAGIEMLSKKRVSFIFATHLHDLSNMKRITELENVEIAHMHVEVDSATGNIIYDRQLRPGSGSALYGLEVCKGLGLPADFLKIAHEVRCELEGTSASFVSQRTSHYNANVIVQECKVCGKPASETHHIQEQHTANKNGWIETANFHKDRAFNLVPLCEECHQDIHHGKKKVHGYVATTQGVVLQVENKDADKLKTNRKMGQDVPREKRKELLWPRIRYHNGWYVRKTSRSKWSVSSDAEVLQYIRKQGISCDASTLDELAMCVFDPSL